MAFVLDASIAVRWFLTAQATPYRSFVLQRSTLEKVHVPAIFPIETAGILLKEWNKGTVSTSETDRFFQLLDEFEICTEPYISNTKSTFVDAQLHGLAPADSSYGKLALNLRIPLASADNRLCKAALTAGLQLLTPLST